MGQSRPLFIYFRLFWIAIDRYAPIISKNFADVGNRTPDLWCRKRPLSQLRNNHGPNIKSLHFLFLCMWKQYTQALQLRFLNGATFRLVLMLKSQSPALHLQCVYLWIKNCLSQLLLTFLCALLKYKSMFCSSVQPNHRDKSPLALSAKSNSEMTRQWLFISWSHWLESLSRSETAISEKFLPLSLEIKVVVFCLN